MLGPMGSHLMSIMQVLTPAEIDLYAQKARERSVRAPMAAGAEELSLAYEQHSAANEHSSMGKEQKQPSSDLDSDTENEDGAVSKQAKIIPFKQNDDTDISVNNANVEGEARDTQGQNFYNEQNEEEDNQNQPSESLKTRDELELIGVYSAAKIKKEREKELESRKRSQPSASLFLIDQRKKMQSSQDKLREQTALKNYQKNAQIESINKEVDLDAENLDEENGISVGVSGILVNKKQF